MIMAMMIMIMRTMRILRYAPRILNFWSSKEKNNREGKREKYLKKENIWSAEEKKTEKEKEKGKGGKYLEKEIIWSVEEKKDREGKGGKYLEKETIWSAGGQDGPCGPSGQP